MPKVFHCSACGGQHKRPVGAKCVHQGNDIAESTSSASQSTQGTNENTNTEILNALNAVSYRLSAIEQRIDRTEEQLHSRPSAGAEAVSNEVSTSVSQEVDEISDAGDDAVIPSAQFLKKSKHIQAAVDERLHELARINEQGRFKSQHGGSEQIHVKHQVPWPQNHVLSGTSKSRTSYDSLSTFQWMAGFCAIIKDENDLKVKNAMLEYLTDLMEDAQDFGWSSAKGAHALILCRMEEGKVNWLMSDKLDRLRRAHAQKIINGQVSGQQSKAKSDAQGVPCRFFQNAKCAHKTDHTTNGQLYRHICSFCHGQGKKFAHALKDCRNKRQETKND